MTQRLGASIGHGPLVQRAAPSSVIFSLNEGTQDVSTVREALRMPCSEGFEDQWVYLEIYMKRRTILAVAAAAITFTASAPGDEYSDLVKEGYRWVTADGLYACVSKDDVRRMVNNPSSPTGDEVALKMVEGVKAYYLIPGTIAQVIEDDPGAGLSEIRMAGITVDLWTLTRFLAEHAIKDTYGVIETPATSGLIPTAVSVLDAGPMPTPDFSPIPEMSPIPGVSPTPTLFISP
jgi:hypothetical protein